MHSDYKVKQITSLYESCNKCGLPIINCICHKAPKINTNAKLWILSTEKEFYRPSNTARLLNLVNPASTEIFLWGRNDNPTELIANINSSIYEPFLVFPAQDEESNKRKVEYNTTEKIPAFILIDGTWKEAQRIFRKSEYLKKLPLISIEPIYKSTFDLRRGAGEGSLCTIEAAIEVLNLNKENENAVIVKDFYDLFLKSYKAGANGHRLITSEK